ncbi:MAG: aldehyde ferredoxin oxidoreductase family protein, partial [Candidatus Thermoplasmatota archaeon]|nr:aldehyde ferredoxin oxidoreductase family protein [Candidatus Thermoplasmatota archaeon]
TGTSVLTSGRFSVSSKSPLTGTIADSNVGGFFGSEFKKAGLDALVVQGKAEKPVRLEITEDNIKIIETELWGLETGEALDRLEGKSAVIGPAGENEVRYASIVVNGHRVFGRGGLGAVMGCKNLKAISVSGSKDVPVADEDALKNYVVKAASKIDSSPVTSRGLKKFGTPILVNLITWLGMYSKKNYRESSSEEEADALSGEKMREEIVEEHEGCYACPIRCGLKTSTDEKEGKGPEYESVWALGANLGNFDLEETTELNYRCNELGLDTISTGGTLACAMEMSEKEIWSKIDGFGSLVKDLLDKIAYREGVGNELAEGSERLCEKYDCDFSMTVKGMELPAYDPRGAAGQALSFATSNRGGCHLRGYMIGEEIFGVPKLFDRFKTSGKAQVVKRSQERNAYLDSLITCKFSAFALDEEYYSRFLSAVTGKDFTVAELHRIGERIYNLERKFNVKAGFDREDDRLPERFSQPLKEGASSDNVFDMEEMLDDYYEVMGWDVEGKPKEETLEELDILDI